MDALTVKQTKLCLLGLSDDFCADSKRMGFDVLADVLALTPQELLNCDGFTYRWLGELITFLQERQLLHLLQPVPGKSSG